MGGLLEYDTDLFAARTITKIISHYKALLETVASNPEQRILEIPLADEEREAIEDLSLGRQNYNDAEEQFAF